MPHEKQEKHDYFAELYVAGMLADKGWNVYFPHRDQGFDFIIAKQVYNDGQKKILIRPVQVKGKFPTEEKGNKEVYGFVGELSQVHTEMVLGIAFFLNKDSTKPLCVAFMPYSEIRTHKKGYRCEPASFKNGEPNPRREFRKYFNEAGMRLMEDNDWKDANRRNEG